MAVFRVPKIKDYTVMSNHHLNNRSLSLKAKGLLSLMLSLPESWNYTMQGLAVIAKDGINSIRSAVKELEEHGYLERRRIRNELGQMADTEYIIKEQPDTHYEPTINDNTSPESNETEYDNSTHGLEANDLDKGIQSTPTCTYPMYENPTLDSPALGKPTYENQIQLSTNKANKKLSNIQAGNIHQSIYPSIVEARNRMDEIEACRQLVKRNIEYDVLVQQHGIERMDAVVSLLTDMISSHKPFIQVNCDEVPAEEVKKRLLGIDAFHVEYVFSKLDTTGSRVRNIRAYMLTALYNAPATMDVDIRAQVHADY